MSPLKTIYTSSVVAACGSMTRHKKVWGTLYIMSVPSYKRTSAFCSYSPLVEAIRNTQNSALIPPSQNTPPISTSEGIREKEMKKHSDLLGSVRCGSISSPAGAQELHGMLMNIVQSVVLQQEQKKQAPLNAVLNEEQRSSPCERGKDTGCDAVYPPDILISIPSAPPRPHQMEKFEKEPLTSDKTLSNNNLSSSSVDKELSSSLSTSPTDLLQRLLLQHRRKTSQHGISLSSKSDEPVLKKRLSPALEMEKIDSHAYSSKASRIAFHMFSEAVQRSGVIPTTQHFNLLLLLAILEEDWSLVDKVEHVHLGLLIAVARKQDKCLLDVEENGERCDLESEEGLVSQAADYSDSPKHSTPGRSTWFSLAALEESMFPNTVTFDLLMEAQLKRARSVLQSTKQKNVDALCSTNAQNVTHLRNNERKVLEGAAWAVLDLLDDRQAKGIPLTEFGLLHAMESLSILIDVEIQDELLLSSKDQRSSPYGVSPRHPCVSKGETLKSAWRRYEGTSECGSQNKAIRTAAVKEGIIQDYPCMSEEEESLAHSTTKETLPSTSPTWKESNDYIWEVAYTLYNSYYAQPRPSHQFQTSSFFYTNPYDYYYNHPDGGMDEHNQLSYSSSVIPGLLPSFSSKTGRYSTPPSALILLHLLKILRAGGQNHLVVEAYEEYERREVLQNSNHRGWWWRRNQGETASSNGEDSALMNWEQLGIFPTNSDSKKKFLSVSSQDRCNEVRHVGWEIWLLVTECAKEVGEWKVALRIWRSAYTTAIAGAAARVALRENLRLPSFNSFHCSPHLIHENEQFDRMNGNEVNRDFGNSLVSALHLSAVPEWMQTYLPCLLQNVLHTLRRVRRYKEVVDLFQKLVREQKTCVHQRWFWTPYSLLLVSQAASAMLQLSQLYGICCGTIPSPANANETNVLLSLKENLSRSVLSRAHYTTEQAHIIYATLPSEVFEITLRTIHFRQSSILCDQENNSNRIKEQLSSWSDEVYHAFLNHMLSTIHIGDGDERNRNALFSAPLLHLCNIYLDTQFLIRGHSRPKVSQCGTRNQPSDNDVSTEKYTNLLSLLHDLDGVVKNSPLPLGALGIVIVCDLLYSVREHIVSVEVPDTLSSLELTLSTVERICTSMLIGLCTWGDQERVSNKNIWSSTAIYLASRALLLCSPFYSNVFSVTPNRRGPLFAPHVISALAIVKEAESLSWLSKRQLSSLYAMVEKAREYEVAHVYHQFLFTHKKTMESSLEEGKSLITNNVFWRTVAPDHSTKVGGFDFSSITKASSPALLNVAMKLMASLNTHSTIPRTERGISLEMNQKLYAERKSLFSQLFHTLSMQLATCSSSRELNASEKVMSSSILIREVIISILEKASLNSNIREDHGNECVELLTIFLPIHNDHLWYLPSPEIRETRNVFYADVRTMEAARRFLRFCKNTEIGLVETLANKWLRITENWYTINTPSKDGQARVTESVNLFSQERAALTELALDVVVWISRHRNKPLLLSCLTWFRNIIPRCVSTKNSSFSPQTDRAVGTMVGDQRDKSQKMFEVGLDSIVIVCQSLSSGPHEDVLRHSWNHLSFFFKDTIFPVLQKRVEMHNCRGGSSDSNKYFINLLDNCVAVLNKLQKTFHSLLVQVSLDAYRLSLENRVDLANLSTNKHLLELLNKVEPAAVTYLDVCEMYMFAAMEVVRKVSFNDSLPLDRGSRGRDSAYFSPYTVLHHILRTLVDSQWDIHFASFVNRTLFLSMAGLENAEHVANRQHTFSRFRQRFHRLLWVEKHFLPNEEKLYSLHMQQWALMMGSVCTAKELASDIAALLEHDIYSVPEVAVDTRLLVPDVSGDYADRNKNGELRGKGSIIKSEEFLVCPATLFVCSVDLFTQSLTKLSVGNRHSESTVLRTGDPLPPLRGTGDSSPTTCFVDPVVFLTAMCGKQQSKRENSASIDHDYEFDPSRLSNEGGIPNLLTILHEAAVRVLHFHLAEANVSNNSSGFHLHKTRIEMFQRDIKINTSSDGSLSLWQRLLTRMLAWSCPSKMYPHLVDAVLLSILVSPTEKSYYVKRESGTGAVGNISPEQLEAMMRIVLNESIALSLFRERLGWDDYRIRWNQKQLHLQPFSDTSLFYLWYLLLNLGNDTDNNKIAGCTPSLISTVIPSSLASQALMKEDLVHLLFRALAFSSGGIESKFLLQSDVSTISKAEAYSPGSEVFLWRILAAFPSVAGKKLRESLQHSLRVNKKTTADDSSLSLAQVHGITYFFENVLRMQVGAAGSTSNGERNSAETPPLSLVRSALSWFLMVYGSLSPFTPFGFVPSAVRGYTKFRNSETSVALVSDEKAFATLMLSYSTRLTTFTERDRSNSTNFLRSLLISCREPSFKSWWKGDYVEDYNLYNCLFTKSFLPRQLAREILHSVFIEKQDSKTPMCQYFSARALNNLLEHAQLPLREADEMKKNNERRRYQMLEHQDVSLFSGEVDRQLEGQENEMRLFLQRLVAYVIQVDEESHSAAPAVRRTEITRALLNYPRKISASTSFYCFSSSSSWKDIFHQLEKFTARLSIGAESRALSISSLVTQNEKKCECLNSITAQVLCHTLLLILEDIECDPLYCKEDVKEEEKENMVAENDERIDLVCSILVLNEVVSQYGTVSENAKTSFSVNKVFLWEYLIPWLHCHSMLYKNNCSGECHAKRVYDTTICETRWERFLVTLISGVLGRLNIFQWGTFTRTSSSSDECIALLRSLCFHVAVMELTTQQHSFSNANVVVRNERLSRLSNFLRKFYRDYTAIRIPTDLPIREINVYQGFWVSSSSSFRCWNQTGLLLGMWREMEAVRKFLVSIEKVNKERGKNTHFCSLWWKGGLFLSVLLTKSILRVRLMNTDNNLSDASFIPISDPHEIVDSLEEKNWYAIQANTQQIRERIEQASALCKSVSVYTSDGKEKGRKVLPTSFVQRIWQCEPLKVVLDTLFITSLPGPLVVFPSLLEGLVKMSVIHSYLDTAGLTPEAPVKKHDLKIQQAIQYLSRATAEEFDLLRRNESSFHDVTSTRKSPRICVCWKILQSNISKISPKVLCSLLFSIASPPSPPHSLPVSTSCTLHSDHLPLPQTVHFIPPQWSSGAIAACENWSDALALLHASLSTLRRSGGKATAVQNLMMQVMLKRLREEPTFRRGISSFSLRFTEESHQDLSPQNQKNLLFHVLQSIQIYNQNPHPSSIIEGTVAVALHCYLCCCGAHNNSSLSYVTSKITPIPRIPQRLMIEMMRTSVHSPRLCVAFYEIFLFQLYIRFEGVHPFLSLLRASKKCFEQSSETESSVFTQGKGVARTLEPSPLNRGEMEAISLIVLAMDGYHRAITGRSLLPLLFKSLRERDGENGALIHCYLVERLRWYMSALNGKETVGSERPVAYPSNISINGQRMMWKSFVDVCRYLATKSRGNSDQQKLSFIVVSLLSEVFRRNGLVSEIEDDMVRVHLFSLNQEKG